MSSEKKFWCARMRFEVDCTVTVEAETEAEAKAKMVKMKRPGLDDAIFEDRIWSSELSSIVRPRVSPISQGIQR